MYETFSHTADLGLRIRADNLDSLMAEAGRALFSVLVANLDTARPVEQVELRVEGGERDYLLLDWLNELLYGFHQNRIILTEFNVRVDNTGLSAICRGEPLDETKHSLDHDIKAITYHGLQVVQSDGRWQAEVIVDI
jgi:SHS2 domain-containing protein